MANPLCKVFALPEKDLAVLQVLRDSLEMSDREAFLAGCRELLATGQHNLLIDLCGLRRVFSVFVGSILDVSARARAENRRLLLKTTTAVAEVFRTVIRPEVLEIIAEPPPEERQPRRHSSRRGS